MRAPAAPDVLETLRERIREIEGVRDRGVLDAGRSTGFANLDRLFPGGGLRPGTLVEWCGGRDGSGALTLALTVAGRLVKDDGVVVVLDGDRDFYPVAAAGLGVPLERTIVVRPGDPAAEVWAWEQALRGPGVVALGRVRTVNDRLIRRLQLAAEAGGGFGFLVRPPGARAMAWGATRVMVEGVAGAGPGIGWRLRVRAARGLADARQAATEVELGHEARAVPVAAELARPVAKRRTARR